MLHATRLVLALVLCAIPLRALADEAAPKEGKIVFDVTEADGKKLLGRIETIEETRQDLLRQGITPRIVVSFRGGATNLVQTDLKKVKPKDRPYAAKIAALLEQLGEAKGVDAIEQCAVAIRHAGTRAEDVLPPIKVVANSYVSLMSHQAQGYAYIRP